jgi:diguanylate cyclase (GGDEF)-like protein/PAS domain S-box-containing protein
MSMAKHLPTGNLRLQRRLLPPLLALLFLLLLTFWFALQTLNRQQIAFHSQEQSRRTEAAFKILREERTQAMDLAMASFIGMDPELAPMIAAADREALRRHYAIAFSLFQDRLAVSHFYFHGPDRRTVLRMHEPLVYGDEIERETLLRAAETWTPASGLELGRNGELSLRGVHPIGTPQEPMGFLELGIEVKGLLADLREKLGEGLGFEFALAIHKRSQLGQQWYTMARTRGPVENWDAHPELAVIDTAGGFPAEVIRAVLADLGTLPEARQGPLEVAGDDRRWLATSIPLDTAGGEIQLIALQDVTSVYRDFDRVALTAFALAAVLCSLLVAGFYQALRIVNAAMSRQQRDLGKAKERLDLALSVANDGIWDWDLVRNRLTFDDRYYTLLGYEPGAFEPSYEEFMQRVHETDRDWLESAIQRHLNDGSDSFEVEFRFRNADDGYQWLRSRGQIVARDRHGRPERFIGTHSDITALKKAEKETEKAARALDKRNRVLSSINRLGREMAAATSIEEIGRLTVEELREQDGAPLVGIYLLDDRDPSQLRLHYYDSDRVNKDLFSVSQLLPIDGSFNGLALKRGEILHCNDFENDQRINPRVKDLFARFGAKAETILPLTYQGRPIGTIAIVYLDAMEYSAEDRWAHDAVAQTASIAIDNFLNVALLRERQRNAEIINELSFELNQSQSVTVLAERALATLQRRETPGTKGVFYLLDKSGETIALAAHEGLSGEELKHAQKCQLAGSWSGVAIEAGSVVSSDDPGCAAAIWADERRRLQHHAIGGVVALPLIYQEKVLGAINLLFETQQSFDEGHIMAYESMARAIALALHGAQNTAQLAHQAEHDSLTGLPNRKALHAHVAGRLKEQNRAPSLALLLLDLNRFKDVNDTLGHHVGDDLLRAFAQRVSPVANAFAGRLFRLGGDEFAIVAETADAWRIADSIISTLQLPFSILDMNLELGCSIGASLFPAHGRDSHELLRCADVAMYSAKQQREHFQLYDNAIDERNPKRLEMLSALRTGLETDQLFLVYQPRIDIASGRVIASEALLRWEHPSFGWVPPDEFIPLAEVTDVIHVLTPWVIRKALTQISAWRDQGLDMRVSVNISGRNLIDVDFPKRVEALLAEFGLLAQCLEFEITETALVSDPDRALRVLRAFSALGIGIAIDDFGTGYSSLDYLKRLPLTFLKIDRTFIRDMLAQSRDAAIVRSTIGLAHSLGLRVVAEGAEDGATCERLRELGCEEVQGYFYSRPLPPDEFRLWMLTRGQGGGGTRDNVIGLP